MDIATLPTWIIAGGMALGGLGIAGWVLTTWLRIKNGYPLDGSWGQALHPKTDRESAERIKLLTQENAQLQAQLSSVGDRLANVERIVTDGSLRLSDDIDRLRELPGDGRAN
ncbi:MAG: hypothetical protein WA906_00610 [Pacificimonas sp.]